MNKRYEQMCGRSRIYKYPTVLERQRGPAGLSDGRFLKEVNEKETSSAGIHRQMAVDACNVNAAKGIWRVKMDGLHTAHMLARIGQIMEYAVAVWCHPLR